MVVALELHLDDFISFCQLLNSTVLAKLPQVKVRGSEKDVWTVQPCPEMKEHSGHSQSKSCALLISKTLIHFSADKVNESQS